MSAAHEQFRQVLRGYDQAEVDRRVDELVRNEQAARPRSTSWRRACASSSRPTATQA